MWLTTKHFRSAVSDSSCWMSKGEGTCGSSKASRTKICQLCTKIRVDDHIVGFQVLKKWECCNNCNMKHHEIMKNALMRSDGPWSNTNTHISNLCGMDWRSANGVFSLWPSRQASWSQASLKRISNLLCICSNPKKICPNQSSVWAGGW